MPSYFPDLGTSDLLRGTAPLWWANSWSRTSTVHLSCADLPTPKPRHPSCLLFWTLTRFLQARQLSTCSTHLSQIVLETLNLRVLSKGVMLNSLSPMNLTFLHLLIKPTEESCLSFLSFLLPFTGSRWSPWHGRLPSVGNYNKYPFQWQLSPGLWPSLCLVILKSTLWESHLFTVKIMYVCIKAQGRILSPFLLKQM